MKKQSRLYSLPRAATLFAAWKLRPLAAGALTAFSTLTACTPVDALNALVPTSNVVITRDVAYGDGPRARLDIYRPAGDAAGRPVVVFLYGGGWRAGTKGDYLFVGAALARRGIVAVVPDYRLYPEVRFPDFLQDCADAVAWTLHHIDAYGGNLRQVSVMGHSAGAYNAVMLALDPRLLAAAGARRDELAAVVGLAGPYDFLPITDPDVIPVFASVGDGPASQPVNYVDGRGPPMLLLSGNRDETVDPGNVDALANRVRQAGGEVQTAIYPGIGHIGIILAVARPFAWRAPVLADVVAFVSGHVIHTN